VAAPPRAATRARAGSGRGAGSRGGHAADCARGRGADAWGVEAPTACAM
jgi:hypothetical protein